MWITILMQTEFYSNEKDYLVLDKVSATSATKKHIADIASAEKYIKKLIENISGKDFSLDNVEKANSTTLLYHHVCSDEHLQFLIKVVCNNVEMNFFDFFPLYNSLEDIKLKAIHWLSSLEDMVGIDSPCNSEQIIQYISSNALNSDSDSFAFAFKQYLELKKVA